MKKENASSPRKLKQMTISGLWRSRSETKNISTAQEGRESKKRKAEKENGPEDAESSSSKRIFYETGNCSQWETKNLLAELDVGFSFEDFENNPFLSPKKNNSPKKVLAENCSQSSSASSEDDNWQQGEFCLSFESPRRCLVGKVAVVTSGRFEQILLVNDEKTEERGICRLRDVWVFTAVSSGDSVVIQTGKSDEGWVVDNKRGYIVLHPNIVLSSTSLLKASYCMRKGLLANFYKGMESGTNAVMIVGRLVHELFQKSLKSGSCTDEDFLSFASQYLQACDYLHDIYFSNKSFKEVRREVENYVPAVRKFLDVYLTGVSEPFGQNFTGTIEDILDIEELIRSPTLGLQGRVDVTLKVKSDREVKTAPLELKTGKASFSADHKRQLIMYVLLMQEIGRKVEYGLLLYLKENIMEEIKPSRDEIRNLFLMRNKLAGYFLTFKKNELPEPIRSSNCDACPYLRICTSHLKSETLYESHPLRSLEFPDVKPSHVEYFARWNKLLWLEFGDTVKEDEEDATIDDMRLESEIREADGDYKQCFKLKLGGNKDRNSFQSNPLVYVYDDKGNRIGSGKVMSFTSSGCCLSASQPLSGHSKTYKIAVFKKNFLSLYLSNIGLLLEERYRALRDIVIDEKPPSFDEKLEKKIFKEICLEKIVSLNKEQQRAVLKALLSRDYALIKGPPGTGKTQTIVALVRVLVALGKKVLIAGHTNNSVDNVLLRLQDVEFMRLGHLKSVCKNLHDRCHVNLKKNCQTVEDVKRLFDVKVIGSTCSGLDFDFLEKMKFDVCIVDESSQSLDCEIIRPLLCAEKFVLVGDEDQLPPIVQNIEAKNLGMGKSLFERLAKSGGAIKLKFQYRMNSRINSLANSIAYDGLLECANEEVAGSTIRIEIPETSSESSPAEWINETLSANLEKSVMFVDTSGYFSWKGIRSGEKSRCSRLEANIVLALLLRLRKCGFRDDSVGVIAPYADQIALLRAKMDSESLEKIELNTVDQYQGRDKEVIVFSCGKENQPETEASDLELLNDVNRLTVAVTRAKCKLILIGDKRTIAKYHPFKKLLSFLEEFQFVRLNHNEKGFFWNEYEY